MSFLQNRPQYEQMCSEYINLKTIAGNSCIRKPDLVQKFKNGLKHDVSSVRKLERAISMEDLIWLLERQNLLSMIKIELLIKFFALLDAESFKYLEDYRITLEKNYTTLRRFYLEDLRYRDRRTLLEKEIEQAKLGMPAVEHLPEEPPLSAKADHRHVISNAESISKSKFNQKRQEIFTLLSKEIARNWSTFGRLMQLSDSTLEEIEFRHPRNVKAIVTDILETADKQQSENGLENFSDLLMSALVEFRRADLKKKIERFLR